MRSLKDILTEALVNKKVQKTEIEQEMTASLDKFIDAMEASNNHKGYNLHTDKMNNGQGDYIINLYKWTYKYGLEGKHADIDEFMKSSVWLKLFNDDRAGKREVQKLPYYEDFLQAIKNIDKNFKIERYQ